MLCPVTYQIALKGWAGGLPDDQVVTGKTAEHAAAALSVAGLPASSIKVGFPTEVFVELNPPPNIERPLESGGTEPERVGRPMIACSGQTVGMPIRLRAPV